MVTQQKEDFMYAKLYNPKDDTYCTDYSVSGLVMGPETAKRFQENTEQIAVTVCCITYNHEEYIRQALDSFLMQKTNFKYQVFVGEDHSSDGTANIVREYGEKYPDIIVPFLREENIGAQRNLVDLCQHAKSPYIAFCEGDDYWIDEHKLQKQYDYMQKHEKIRLCYTKTEILAPEDWHLNSYYRHEKDGRMLYPNCEPGFKNKSYYTMHDFILRFPNHTSSVFYRWNYDLKIPDWYYQGRIGDMPITSMQLGEGKAVYLPDITSVYRRSDAGIWMNHDNTEHFANTRLDYVHILSNLRDYFDKNYGHEWDGDFRNRITTEIANYLTAAKDYRDPEMIQNLLKQYPEETFDALHTFLGSFSIYRTLDNKLGSKDFENMYSTRKAAYFAIPGIKLYDVMHGVVRFFEKGDKFTRKYLITWFRYWKNSAVKKKKNLWVFSGFRGTSYEDNTMYLYNYVLEHHPEIKAVWLTVSTKVKAHLSKEGKPVLSMDSREGKQALAQAEVAVIDHFVMSDYKFVTDECRPVYGFNAKTKVVQLWHGIGLKSMGDEKELKNTTVEGVQYSRDILPQNGDTPLCRFKKRIKYFAVAPFRELVEEYFFFLCPGWERRNIMAKMWKVPEKACFLAGDPKDTPIYQQERQLSPVKIIYAPTYRFNYEREADMVQEFLEVTPKIQKLMEQTNGEFYLRMHPHTWRNYEHKIIKVIDNYDRIFWDSEGDIYQTLGTYSVMISDYSSIAIDFARIGRPAVFLGADQEQYAKEEAGFDIDYPNMVPGPVTRDWDETLERVQEYIDNPGKDSELRKERCEYFYDSSVNGPDNSERIIQEIKKRIGLD